MTKELSYGFPAWDDIFGSKPKSGSKGAKAKKKPAAKASVERASTRPATKGASKKKAQRK